MFASSAALIRIATAVTLASVIMAGPAAASHFDKTITLRVPVQLKEMVAVGARVTCRIYGEAANYWLGMKNHNFSIPKGQFDDVVEIEVEEGPGHDFAEAKTWTCELFVSLTPSASVVAEPYQGPQPPPAASGDQTYRIARPDEFFRREISGPIGPVAIQMLIDPQLAPNP